MIRVFPWSSLEQSEELNMSMTRLRKRGEAFPSRRSGGLRWWSSHTHTHTHTHTDIHTHAHTHTHTHTDRHSPTNHMSHHWVCVCFLISNYRECRRDGAPQKPQK